MGSSGGANSQGPLPLRQGLRSGSLGLRLSLLRQHRADALDGLFERLLAAGK